MAAMIPFFVLLGVVLVLAEVVPSEVMTSTMIIMILMFLMTAGNSMCYQRIELLLHHLNIGDVSGTLELVAVDLRLAILNLRGCST